MTKHWSLHDQASVTAWPRIGHHMTKHRSPHDQASVTAWPCICHRMTISWALRDQTMGAWWPCYGLNYISNYMEIICYRFQVSHPSFPTTDLTDLLRAIVGLRPLGIPKGDACHWKDARNLTDSSCANNLITLFPVDNHYVYIWTRIIRIDTNLFIRLIRKIRVRIL